MKLSISGHGSDQSLAMLIADGASEHDVAAGYALSGDQERKLRALSKSAGIDFNNFWLTALIKERINLSKPEANKGLLNDDYRRILTNEINAVRPNILVPLSELAFNFCTGLTGIRKFRGSVLPTGSHLQLFSPTIRVLPILGPNPYLNQEPKLEFISRLDFTKIKRNLHETGAIREIGNCWVAESSTQLRNFLERHYNDAKFVVFDIETFANFPTCIGLCFDGQESVCVPLIDKNIDIDNRVLMLDLVLRLLRSPLPKVNQNVKFDWRKLARFGWEISPITGDTLLAAACLYCEYPKNLGFLTSIYTDMPYFKDEGKEFDPAKYDRKKLYLYNAKDCLATHQIYQQQLQELNETGTMPVYQMLIDILPFYKWMEETGILVDDTQRKKLLAKYTCLYEIHKYKLERLLGREFNPLSSVSVGKLVYEDLGFKVVRGIGRRAPKRDAEGNITKEGGPKADEDALELLIWMGEGRSQYGKAILRTIIDCRKLHKVIEFLQLPTFPDGRHRCEFNLAGAETGRTTTGETTDYYLTFDKGKVKLRNYGHSFQNIGKHGFTVDGVEYGKELRSIFVPTPGYSFVECDLSQAEARVDAVLASDYDILAVFDGPIGIHRLTGSWVYGCEPNEIVKNKLTLNSEGVGEDRYHIAKTVRHAGERNMREERLMLMIHKPLQECRDILEKRFHPNQPNIRRVFHAEIKYWINRNPFEGGRLLTAPNGRRRQFFGRIDHKAINEAISFLPQAIVTDYLKDSLRRTIPETQDFARPLSEAHDGFLSEVLCGREIEYASAFKRNVEKPIDFKMCTLSRDFKLIIPCEAEMSTTSWQEMRGLKL